MSTFFAVVNIDYTASLEVPTAETLERFPEPIINRPVGIAGPRFPVCFERQDYDQSYLFLPAGTLAYLLVSYLPREHAEYHLRFENIPDTSENAPGITEVRQAFTGVDGKPGQLVHRFEGPVSGKMLGLTLLPERNNLANLARVFLTDKEFNFGWQGNAPYVTKAEYESMMRSSYADPPKNIPPYRAY